VGTRFCMCHGVWEVWVQGLTDIVCISELLIYGSVLSYSLCCRNYMYTYIYIYIYIYTYPIHIQCAILYTNMDFAVAEE